MNKKLAIRIGSGILALAMIIPLVVSMVQGSGKKKTAPDSAVAKYEEYEIPTGAYILQVMRAYSEALNKLGQYEGKLSEQKIDDIPANEWIEKKADEYITENLAIINEFYKRGLSLTDEQNDYIKKATEDMWKNYAQSYQAAGIPINSIETMNIIEMQANEVFNDIYKDYPTEDLKKYFSESSLLMNCLTFSKKDEEGNALTEEKLAQIKADAKSYKEKLNKGEDAEKVIAEYEEKYMPELKHDHSLITNHKLAVKNDESSEFIKFLNSKPFGEADIFEDENYILVGVRYDINKNDSDFNEIKDALLAEIKGEEFTQTVKDLAKQIKPEFNKELKNKYGVEYINGIIGTK